MARNSGLSAVAEALFAAADACNAWLDAAPGRPRTARARSRLRAVAECADLCVATAMCLAHAAPSALAQCAAACADCAAALAAEAGPEAERCRRECLAAAAQCGGAGLARAA